MGAGYENDGNGAVVSLPSDGTRIGTAGARSVTPGAVGVPTTGRPQFGAVFTGWRRPRPAPARGPRPPPPGFP